MGLGSYKTAWLTCHKIRTAMVEDIKKVGGIVEADETYVGGKRGVVGTYTRSAGNICICTSPEFQFQYHNRESVDILGTAIKRC
jgi:hypothetical protein